jgi:hypothetical protein
MHGLPRSILTLARTPVERPDLPAIAAKGRAVPAPCPGSCPSAVGGAGQWQRMPVGAVPVHTERWSQHRHISNRCETAHSPPPIARPRADQRRRVIFNRPPAVTPTVRQERPGRAQHLPELGNGRGFLLLSGKIPRPRSPHRTRALRVTCRQYGPGGAHYPT